MFLFPVYVSELSHIFFSFYMLNNDKLGDNIQVQTLVIFGKISYNFIVPSCLLWQFFKKIRESQVS